MLLILAASLFLLSREIRGQVATLSQANQPAAPSSRAQLSREITTLESELDGYARALHEKHPRFGLSYRQMKAIEGQAEASFPTVRALPSLHRALGECSAAEWNELCRRVKEIGCLFHRADALNNPWCHRQPSVRMTATLRTDVEAILKRLEELDFRHLEHIKRFGPGIDQPGDPVDFLSTAPEVVRRLHPLTEDQPTAEAQITQGWLRAARPVGDDELIRLAEPCREAVILAEQAKATSLDPIWAERCERLSELQLEDLRDAARIVLAWRGRSWRFLSLTYRRAKAAVHRLRPGAVGEAFWSSAESLLAHLEARQLRVQLARMNESLIPQAPFRQPDEQLQVQFPRLASNALEDAAWLSRAGRTRTWIAELLVASLASADRARLEDLLAKAKVSIERAPILVALRETLDELELFLLPEGLEEPRRAIEGRRSIREWIKNVAKGLDALGDLVALDLDRQRRDGLVRVVLGSLEDYEQDRFAGRRVPEPPDGLPDAKDGRWWEAMVQYAASQVWQGACEREYPDLIRITPEAHAAKVRQLGDLLQSKRAKEAEAIRACWATRQATHRNAPWAQMFALRAGNQNGGAKTLRQAIHLSLKHGLLDLRPCWLANPAAVSQIFPLEPGLFDLVIFDEASQCPVEQALPAIYRGKALIVSGDEKQLPPTGFFVPAGLVVAPDGGQDEEDESDGEATDSPVDASARQIQQLGQEFMLDVKDLLQAAVGLFPSEAQADLLVHYRSRHPALIEFSNHAFYDGRLEAPPSVHDGSCGVPPIQYRSVGGTYSDRKNRDEAEEVVRVLRKFWLGVCPCRTIGVVTFNKPQQELIEDLIEEECLRDESFAVRYQQELSRRVDNQDVGFFIRNLENVQGDERDVMVFSTTFGRDPQGRFLRCFGPVGQVGGERRLNVAVTRARDQVIIVGSMPIDEIATALNSSQGPGSKFTPSGYLQLYLAYARAVSAGDSDQAKSILQRLSSSPSGPDDGKRKPPPGPESPFEEEVLEVLRRWDLNVNCQVGDSGFLIDLAIRHRDPTRGYALGIECDGAMYHSDRTARARDVWREDILRRRGWTFHRIWSTRWWSYRAREIAMLKVEVDRALSCQGYMQQGAGQFTVSRCPVWRRVHRPAMRFGEVPPRCWLRPWSAASRSSRFGRQPSLQDRNACGSGSRPRPL